MIAVALPIYTDPSYLSFSSPFGRALHFSVVELVVLAGFALTVRHAVARYRAGDRYHVFQWLVIFVYGIAMELLAFNYFQNYEHARFTVQLYHGKLPLYVTAVYVVFHYTGLKSIERLRLSWAAEALLVGFAICMLDVPFDTLGVDAGWWRWSTTDANLGHRWLGVPVTSYYWYLLFGAIFAALCRAVRGRVERRPVAAYVVLAPLVAVSVIVLGVVAFLPFHGLVALGVPEGTIVAAHLAACAALALGVRAPLAEGAPPDVLAVTAGLHGAYLAVLAGLWSAGAVQAAPAKLAAIVSAAVTSAIVAFGAPLGRRIGRPASAAS